MNAEWRKLLKRQIEPKQELLNKGNVKKSIKKPNRNDENKMS